MLGKLIAKGIKVATLPLDAVEIAVDYMTGGDGSRQPSEVELEAARFQGAHVARIAAKQAG